MGIDPLTLEDISTAIRKLIESGKSLEEILDDPTDLEDLLLGLEDEN